MGSDLEVRATPAPGYWKDFAKLPFAVYAGDPNWVVPLRSQLRTEFQADDPYLQRVPPEMFVAYHDRRPVARIVASYDAGVGQAFGDEPHGFFSHFEALDDQAAVGLLFERARGWLRARGASRMIGPMSARVTDPRGVLVEGSGRSVYGMPYNPSYYAAMLEGVGLTKAMDLLEVVLEVGALDPRVQRMASIARRHHPGLQVRHLDLRQLDADLASIVDVYNEAYAKNWGFIPLRRDDMQYAAKKMRPIFQPDFGTLLECDGRCVGFSMMMPDVNELLHRLRGRLYPLGWLTMLRGLSRLRVFRAFFISIIPAYRNRGFEAVLLESVSEVARRRAIERVHVGWTLENNAAWRNQLTSLAGLGPRDAHRRYRLYQGEA